MLLPARDRWSRDYVDWDSWESCRSTALRRATNAVASFRSTAILRWLSLLRRREVLAAKISADSSSLSFLLNAFFHRFQQLMECIGKQFHTIRGQFRGHLFDRDA